MVGFHSHVLSQDLPLILLLENIKRSQFHIELSQFDSCPRWDLGSKRDLDSKIECCRHVYHISNIRSYNVFLKAQKLEMIRTTVLTLDIILWTQEFSKIRAFLKVQFSPFFKTLKIGSSCSQFLISTPSCL